MKKITLLMILTALTSCNITTNIVDHYDCQGKEDLLAKNAELNNATPLYTFDVDLAKTCSPTTQLL